LFLHHYQHFLVCQHINSLRVDIEIQENNNDNKIVKPVFEFINLSKNNSKKLWYYENEIIEKQLSILKQKNNINEEINSIVNNYQNIDEIKSFENKINLLKRIRGIKYTDKEKKVRKSKNKIDKIMEIDDELAMTNRYD
jgi:hypothetical protein